MILLCLKSDRCEIHDLSELETQRTETNNSVCDKHVKNKKERRLNSTSSFGFYFWKNDQNVELSQKRTLDHTNRTYNF